MAFDFNNIESRNNMDVISDNASIAAICKWLNTELHDIYQQFNLNLRFDIEHRIVKGEDKLCVIYADEPTLPQLKQTQQLSAKLQAWYMRNIDVCKQLLWNIAPPKTIFIKLHNADFHQDEYFEYIRFCIKNFVVEAYNEYMLGDKIRIHVSDYSHDTWEPTLLHLRTVSKLIDTRRPYYEIGERFVRLAILNVTIKTKDIEKIPEIQKEIDLISSTMSVSRKYYNYGF